MKRYALLIVLLAFVAATPGCGIKVPATVTPRDITATAISAFSHAIGGVQDGVKMTCEARVKLTVVQCQDAGKAFAKVWEYDVTVIDGVLAWQPGQPLPQNLSNEINAVKALVEKLGLDGVIPDKMVGYYRTLADVLRLFLPAPIPAGGVA